jgi:hypothetical protein
VVSRSAPLPEPSGMIVCTEPLPNERVPMTAARLWSCSAPATISEAEAEPPLLEPSGMMVCSEPLPKERVPTTVARRWSCSAPPQSILLRLV